MSESRMVDISQEDYDLLRRIKEYENTMEEESQRLGFRWHEVGVYAATLNKLVVKGLVRVSYKSRAETRYRLTERALALLEVEPPEGTVTLSTKVEREEELKFNPMEMFSDIIGYDDIKELLRESLQLDKPIHVLLYGPPSLAKSVDGGTPIIISDSGGVQVAPIAQVYEEYHAGENVMALSVNPTSLKTHFRPIRQATKHNVGSGEAVKVRIRSGREIVANRDHSFLKYANGRLEPIIAGKLRVGDLVPVVYRTPEIESRSFHDGFKLTSEFGFLVGLWLAEGSFSRNYILIGITDESEGKNVAALADTQICGGCFWYQNNVHILDTKFRALLFELLRPGAGKMKIKGTYSNFKTIAPWVFTSPRKFREGIIRGYWQGDGRYDGSIGSSSPWLAREMPVLLSTLGIATGTFSVGTPYSGHPFYRYRVVGEHMDKLSSIAPSVKAHKGSRGYLLNIPISHELYSGITKSSPGIFARDKEWRGVCGKIEYKAVRQGYVSSEYASRLLTYPSKDGEYWSRLEALLGADVFWSPIEEINSCDCSVMYDISVTGDENFVLGNGILTHNSMFLWDIERAFGDLSLPLLGSATSHAGLWDLIAERKPRVILVDELEKMSLVDMAGLLSIMQTGRIIRAKVGRKLDEKINAWVIGAANRIHKLPPELISRFSVHQLAEYAAKEFRDVVTSVLVAHEDTSQDEAYEIAMRLVGRTHDVRDAVRVARLAKRVGVKRSIELLLS